MVRYVAQMSSKIPWLCVAFCNMLSSTARNYYTPPNPQAGGPHLVCCPKLLIQHILIDSYNLYSTCFNMMIKQQNMKTNNSDCVRCDICSVVSSAAVDFYLQ
jgi:hypothetical protein